MIGLGSANKHKYVNTDVHRYTEKEIQMYQNIETQNDERSNIVEHTLACIRGTAKETANGVHLRQTMQNMMT